MTTLFCHFYFARGSGYEQNDKLNVDNVAGCEKMVQKDFFCKENIIM